MANEQVAVPRPWEKSPLHLAIEFVEDQLSQQGKAVLRDLIRQQAKATLDARSIQYVDHSLKVLIHGGYVRRRHLDTGHLAYEPTKRWKSRRTLLGPLKTPPYVKRFRPRSEAYLEAKRLGLPFPKPADFHAGVDLRKRRKHSAQQSLVFESK